MTYHQSSFVEQGPKPEALVHELDRDKRNVVPPRKRRAALLACRSMFTGSQPQMFAEYNRWMNEKLYAAVAQLSDEQRKRDLGAFFKSIHATLEHVLRADTLWLTRFRGEPVVAATGGGLLYPDFDALRVARAACDQQLTNWAATLTGDWLAKPYPWTSVAGARFTMPGFAVVAQIFNHQTHHRGQATTLLTQLGIDVGATDLPMLPALDALAH